MKKDVVYELIEEDVQYVAEQSLGRKLDRKEIEELIDVIAVKINWFDAIESAIDERIVEGSKMG